MSNALERGWGPPGSGRLVLIPCPGIPLRVRAEVAPLFTTLVQRLDAARRAAGKSQLTSSGGYNLRPVRGYEDRYAATKDLALLSNHSWALAADLNAGANPMGAPLRTDMPAQTRAIAESCGLTWGAEWSRPDPMHFEFLGTPAEAAQWAARLTQEDDMFDDKDRAALGKLYDALPRLTALADYVAGRGRQADDRVLGALSPETSTALNDADGSFLVKKIDQVLLGQDDIRARLAKLEAKP